MKNHTIGGFLASMGCTRSIWWGSAPQVLRTTPWTEGAPWDGQDTRITYRARYGYINEALRGDGADPAQLGLDRSLLSSGTTVGEVTGGGSALLPALQQLARRADNPFNLRNNASYVVTPQDEQDVRVVKDPVQDVAVWMTTFAALLHQQVQHEPAPPANVSPGVTALPHLPQAGAAAPIPLVPFPPQPGQSSTPTAPPAAPAAPVDPMLHLLAVLFTAYLTQRGGSSALLAQLVPVVLNGQADPTATIAAVLASQAQ